MGFFSTFSYTRYRDSEFDKLLNGMKTYHGHQ
jgi:hypothetical protein